MNIDCRNWIGGQWVEGPETAENTCPADVANVLGTRPISGADEANAAIAAAKAAFPAWRDTPAPKRGEYLFKLVRLLERDQERLAEVLSMEEGKIIAEARGEVGKTIRYVEFAAGDARRMTGITAPSEVPGTFGMTIWRPHGVVGLITPWNFPVCIPLWKIAPAIAAGNTVVLKPAPETPATAHLIGKLIAEAGIPPGVVNIVHGDVEPATTIIDHPDVAVISFTGSTEVGRIVEARCGALHKPVQCELGGKNPILVFSDADIELAAGACAKGAFGSTGQRCTATSRAIVMNDVADEFVARVLEHAGSVVAGHPLDEDTTMGPSVSDRQLEQVLKYMEIGKGESELLCGGSRLMEGNLGGGYFPAPTLFDHVACTARIATEEIFGPVLSVIRVNSVDEAIAVANGVKFGLTGSVFTRDISHAFRIINELEVGMTHINNPTIGGEAHMPFGGIKATGVGPREMGPDAWKFYAESKTVYINHALAKRTSNLF
jgi:acyl-CoA reductase-like NAD-dependent aldehyde dehydrogenase